MGLIDFILHVDSHLLALVDQYGSWVYSILFLIVFIETGVVAMDEADFVAAATKGFDFELAGKAGKIVGRIPAHAFRRVLDLKSSMKLPPAAANKAPPAKAQAPAEEDVNIDDD